MGAEALPDDTLQKAEHVDLIQFGLIPEFVGRFPIMCSLQVTCTRRANVSQQRVSNIYPRIHIVQTSMHLELKTWMLWCTCWRLKVQRLCAGADGGRADASADAAPQRPRPAVCVPV